MAVRVIGTGVEVKKSTLTRVAFASEEERLAATHAAQEKARIALASRSAFLTTPTYVREFTMDLKFDGLIVHDIVGGNLISVEFSDDTPEEFTDWYFSFEKGDAPWTDALPTPNTLLGTFKADTETFIPREMKKETIQERINRRIRERREAGSLDVNFSKPVAPQVREDKAVLMMPDTVPFNRENLRAFYQRQARKVHPDKNPGKDTTELFKRLQTAYERLLLEASE